MFVQQISAGPALWSSSGPDQEIQGDNIWKLVDRALRSDFENKLIKCDGLSITNGELYAAIEALPWKPSYRLVGIMMSRCISAVAATLAVWKNDAVYVPIAVEYPLVQMLAITENCGLDLIISDRLLLLPCYREVGCQSGVDGVVMRFYERIMPAGTVTRDIEHPGLCYIAHTSGSSGAPKGVRVTHSALLNRIAAMRQFLDVGPEDRFLYKIPTLFDVHIWEFVLPIVCGCMLVIYRETTRFCLLAVSELIIEERVSIVGFTPAMLCVLLKSQEFVEDNVLRVVICGGEAWAPQLASDVYARMPHVVLYNSYGPTETTMVVTNWRVPNRPGPQEISLGQPHANTTLVVEEHARIMTSKGLQVTGELLVGGEQVALGYIGATASNPFSERSIGGRTLRFYATGDMVRLDVSTGNLCFQGRKDNQIKINGVRIELDEVENALRSIDVVNGCVAFVAESGGAGQLWAFFTTADDREVSIDHIRAECARQLSRFKIPSVLRHVQTLPVRENGKIDRGVKNRFLVAQEPGLAYAEKIALKPLADVADHLLKPIAATGQDRFRPQVLGHRPADFASRRLDRGGAASGVG